MAKKKALNKPSLTRIKPLFIVFIIIIALGGIYIFYEYKSCLRLNPVICLTSKKYENKQLGYSFRYPNYFPISKPTKDWEIKQSAESGTVDRISFEKDFSFNAGSGDLGYVIVEKPTQGNSLEEYKKELLRPRYAMGGGDSNIPAGKKILLPSPVVNDYMFDSGIKALMVGSVQPSLSKNGVYYVFFKNGLQYEISFNSGDYYHPITTAKMRQDGDELILLTFKFTK